jgi:hypothetical protein
LETAVFQGLIPTLFGGTKVWEKEQSAIGECFTVNYVRPIFRHTRKQVISRATRREPYLWPQLLTAVFFSRNVHLSTPETYTSQLRQRPNLVLYYLTIKNKWEWTRNIVVGIITSTVRWLQFWIKLLCINGEMNYGTTAHLFRSKHPQVFFQPCHVAENDATWFSDENKKSTKALLSATKRSNKNSLRFTVINLELCIKAGSAHETIGDIIIFIVLVNWRVCWTQSSNWSTVWRAS